MQFARIAALAGVMLSSQFIFSQNLFTATNVQAAQSKLTRTAIGKPGSSYWQNSGDYDIKVNFDPATNLLSGEETITYSNNSPDTLKRLIIRLYPDHYKKGVARVDNISEKDLNEGVSIDGLVIGAESITGFPSP